MKLLRAWREVSQMVCRDNTGRQSSLNLDERLTLWKLNMLCGGSSGPKRHSPVAKAV